MQLRLFLYSRNRKATAAHLLRCLGATMVDVSHHHSRGPRGPGQHFNVSLFQQCHAKTGPSYMEAVSKLVSDHRSECLPLEDPAGTTFTIGDLHDTIYRGKDDELTEWEQFYLPDIVKMQVVGLVEKTSCSCDQLVLMTCEDKKVYAYDGEELHLVASSLARLCDKMEYPSSITYYRGQAFQHMTEKDWAEVRKGDVGRRLDEEHHRLVTANKSDFLEKLRLISENTGVSK